MADMYRFCKECTAVHKSPGLCLPCLATRLHEYTDTQELIDEMKLTFDWLAQEFRELDNKCDS